MIPIEKKWCGTYHMLDYPWKEERKGLVPGDKCSEASEEKVIEAVETEKVSRKVDDPSNKSSEVLELESRQTRLG